MSVIDRDIAAPSVPAIVAQRLLLRALAIAVLGLAIVYFGWRLTSSVNWRFWWFAVPLLVAELYSAVDTCLFALTMWRIRDRGEPPPPARDVTVDVFVTRYDEPVELLRRTTRAARDISYPHRTYVLDDGDSSEVAAMAAEEGVEYVTRGEE